MTTSISSATPSPASTEAHGDRGRAARLALGLLLAAAALAVACLASLAIGNKALSLSEVWLALTQPGESYAHVVVDSRIPRTVLGAVAGTSLAVAGVIIQGITRNPLGDPGLLGVNAGASAAIVTGIAFLGVGSASVWAAIPGAFLAVVVVYVLGSGRRGVTPLRLVLAGAVITAVLTAYVQAVALTHPDAFDNYRFWVVGALAGRGFDVVGEVIPFVVAGLGLAILLVPGMNVLALGDDTARALGASTALIRVGGAASATLLSAAATAACGPIAFVGLAVPHMVRPFTGPDHRWLLPYCAMLGPVLLLAADIIGRIVVRPGELMVGIVTAFLGAPILMLSVRRMKGRA
ncbi:iron chelate uptake ABC transporter family permease subunit [Phytoactinopolyspora alkaliphila]|uniref:Iron chelate uptake ABC transporter family permease subunit n=1 Tax=Phytoactinopolyspora alkaliphila TaxID=1783498 RepID=A0A6N9YMM3_9ACTN|nr:iron chelate uptake ABC transporter family permease subunit [Phytoactinopolyspora alkaliphila]NED96108.1 iron chelate uptake ABC transporter family permease subunit [Phytoactinopolyspora alkaliphila]